MATPRAFSSLHALVTPKPAPGSSVPFPVVHTVDCLPDEPSDVSRNGSFGDHTDNFELLLDQPYAGMSHESTLLFPGREREYIIGGIQDPMSGVEIDHSQLTEEDHMFTSSGRSYAVDCESSSLECESGVDADSSWEHELDSVLSAMEGDGTPQAPSIWEDDPETDGVFWNSENPWEG
eukprot:ANDGO_03819.mRNA.1 hypothetical protein